MTQKKTSIKAIQFLGRLLGIAVVLALLAWVLGSFDIANVDRALQSASYIYLFPIGVATAVNFATRALRWGTLLNDEHVHHWDSLFIAMMIWNLANNVLPARSGDIVRAYVLGQRDGTSKTKVMATVIVERVADLFVTLLFMALITIGCDRSSHATRPSVLADLRTSDLLGAGNQVSGIVATPTHGSSSGYLGWKSHPSFEEDQSVPF